MRNSTVVKAIYNGNDVARRWSIPFEYIKTEEIGVILTTTILGNDSEEVVSTDDYTIDTDTNEVVYPSDLSEPPVETGKKVTIYRTTDLLQKTDFTNQGAVWPEAIEDSLDKLHQIVQEHTEEIGRSFKTNKSSSVSPEQYAAALIAASDAAVTAASNAAISETNAGNSATSASNSATAAHNSELAAAGSETNASLSATAAGNSATAAHNSELAAASSETNAGLSATAAHNSELAAASSETNAGNSATAAGNYATAAHNSEVAAEAAEGRISDRWGLRKKSTTYAADDMTYHVDLPTGWYLECTTGGTTSASDLVITSPSVGDTVTDGTVTWTIRKIGSGGDGVPLGAIIAYSANGELPSGYLLCDGSAVSRTMFPDLFAAIGTTYGAGDGSTTFNLPDYNAAERFCQGSTVAGTVKTAGLPNITGETGYYTTANIATPNGALYEMDTVRGYLSSSNSGGSSKKIGMDASRSSPIYGASTTVQPNALTARFIIKAYDGVTPTPSEADISNMLTELTGKATRALDNLSAEGENHFLEQDFTIIYPNGGSEANPANITVASSYIEANPFPNYIVHCQVELLYNNEWGVAQFDGYYSSGWGGHGAFATQHNNGNIILKTGSNSILGTSQYQYTVCPSSWSNIDANQSTLPCRVKVWKIGKIPTT